MDILECKTIFAFKGLLSTDSRAGQGFRGQSHQAVTIQYMEFYEGEIQEYYGNTEQGFGGERKRKEHRERSPRKNKGCLGWVLQIEGLEARQDMV